jgi:low temperature requirement protein LtrA
MARDVFSLAHFPMLCGVVAYAVVLEEAIAHPGDALPASGRVALALGMFLFLGGTSFAMWRATCGRPVARTAIALVTAAALFLVTGVPAFTSLSIALVGVGVIAALDERRANRVAG